MGSIGPMELIVIMVIALLVFGPKKLPEIGRGLGSALREFRRHSRDLMSYLDTDEPGPRRVYPETPSTVRPADESGTPPVYAETTPTVEVEPADEREEAPQPALPPSNTHPTG